MAKGQEGPRFAPGSLALEFAFFSLFFKHEEEGVDNTEASEFIYFGSRCGDPALCRCRRGTWLRG
jgi:hypothetical protein